VLGGTFSQDINFKVDLVHLFVVVRGILIFDCFTLSLKLSKGPFEVLLLFLQSSLDNLSSDKKSFLQVFECLILDMDGGFFIQFLVFKLQLLQDWKKVILVLCILDFIGYLLFILLHLVSCLLVDTLFKDLAKDLIRLALRPLLVNDLLFITSQISFTGCLLLFLFDFSMASLFHIVDLLKLLLLFRFIIVFLVDVTRLTLTNKLLSIINLWLCKYLPFLVVVVNNDFTLIRLSSFKFEDSLSDLLLSWSSWVQIKFLGHLLDDQRLPDISVINR
jgi:hypothetical protein